MRSADKARCVTPSTEAATNQQILYSENYLTELLQLLYLEDYTYAELSKYFEWSFMQLDGFTAVLQSIYKSIQIYMNKILQNIKDEFDFGQNYVQPEILNLLYKSYEISHSKHQQLQLVANAYNSSEAINCDELFRNMFVDMIIREPSIQLFLTSMEIKFKNKFYSSSYKSMHKRLQFFNKLLEAPRKPVVRIATRRPRPVAIPIVVPSVTKQQHVDEIKEFEQLLDDVFSQQREQLEVFIPASWNIKKRRH